MGKVSETALGKKVRCPRCGVVFDVTEELVEKGAERRRTERVGVEDLDLDFGLFGGTAQVLDLSVSGVGFEPTDADKDFKKGEVVTLTLLEKQSILLKNVNVRITRIGSMSFGGEFHQLSSFQLAEVKNLLERQKYASARKEQEQQELLKKKPGSKSGE